MVSVLFKLYEYPFNFCDIRVEKNYRSDIMKKILLIIFIILNTILCSEEYKAYSEKITMAEKKMQRDLKKEGEWLEYHKNGNLKFKGNYRDGKKEGEWLEYYENGNIKSKGYYKNGQKDGTWIFYRESGKLKKVRRYINGYLVDPRFSA